MKLSDKILEKYKVFSDPGPCHYCQKDGCLNDCQSNKEGQFLWYDPMQLVPKLTLAEWVKEIQVMEEEIQIIRQDTYDTIMVPLEDALF